MKIRLSGERYEEIKQIITDLFIECKISCVPISGFEIATKLGVKVIPYSSIPLKNRYLLHKKSEDGFSIEKTKGEWYIYYNDEEGYGRVNNTIMHEIGHIVLDHSEESQLAEKEVNFFAKYALAPPPLIHKLELDSAIDIATRFEISYEAAGYALSYYNKWLRYGESDFTNYELCILNLFKDVI